MEALNLNEIINLLSVLALAAAVAGFMAGLLGVGGGIIMVPALYYAFTVLDFDIVTRMHLSVGTSLAIIIPTSIISTKTHMEYDAVDFKMVKSFGLFIVAGVIAGTFLADKFYKQQQLTQKLKMLLLQMLQMVLQLLHIIHIKLLL